MTTEEQEAIVGASEWHRAAKAGVGKPPHLCCVSDGSYECTRLMGHPSEHIAAGGSRVYHRWVQASSLAGFADQMSAYMVANSTPEPVCECGAFKTIGSKRGAAGHSSWCPWVKS